MKYFLDFEFVEGKISQQILGFNIPTWLSKPLPNIQIISIGIVSEEIKIRNKITRDDCYKCSGNFTLKCELCTKTLDNSHNNGNPSYHLYDGKNKEHTEQKEYYAVSKDFNLKAAWDNKWVRENVLKQIFNELESKDYKEYNKALQFGIVKGTIGCKFTLNNLKKYINRYGKTNKQIAQEIKEFIGVRYEEDKFGNVDEVYDEKDIFYGYYNSTDRVAFYNLFSDRMLNMPKRIHWCCRELKQTLDEKLINGIKSTDTYNTNFIVECNNRNTLEEKLEIIKKHPNYPKQTNEHNALADAKWNYELYKFLNTL